jgi:hypothetical protein
MHVLLPYTFLIKNKYIMSHISVVIYVYEHWRQDTENESLSVESLTYS